MAKINLAPKPMTSQSPKASSHVTVLELAPRNLQAMREWYRSLPTGHTPSHTVIQEVAVGNTEAALRDALEGKTWQPPR